MPLFRLHDFLSESLAHSERLSGLLLLGFVVIAAMSLGTWLRRQVRKSWLGKALRTDTFSATAADNSVTLANQQSNRSLRKRCLSPYLPKTWAPALRLTALLLVGIAAADPRMGRETSDAGRSSEQIVLLLDRSRSMVAADAEPTRFGLARHVAADVIDRAQGASIAIVSFAGDARIESPLSRDPSPLHEQLETLEPEQDERSGTHLTQGLMLAMDCFASRFVGPKRLIVLTDGETHEPVSLAGVRILKDVDVLFLGIGDSINGARIPLKPGENDGRPDSPQYLTYKGRTVWTKPQPKNLQDLARQLNGQSQMITSAAEGSRIISAARGDVQKSLRWDRLATATPIYSPLLLAALVLLVLESLGTDTFSAAGTDTFSARTAENSITLANQQSNRAPRKRCLSPYPPETGATIASALLAMLVLWSASGASPLPDSAETYNRGVEAYRSSAWQEAEAQFRQALASGDEQVSRQASFNLANTQYQWVRKGGMSKQEAMSRLQESIACYRRCIQENQRPADARANLQIVYALLKHIEHQEPKDRQSGSDDKDQVPASPPSNNQPADRGQGDKPPPSEQKPGTNSSPGDASKPDKPGQSAMSTPPDASGGQTQDKLTDGAAENELRRIRDQARRRGAGKKPALIGPTVPSGPPW
jgi:Ca-activated chloride channel homolog